MKRLLIFLLVFVFAAFTMGCATQPTEIKKGTKEELDESAEEIKYSKPTTWWGDFSRKAATGTCVVNAFVTYTGFGRD